MQLQSQNTFLEKFNPQLALSRSFRHLKQEFEYIFDLIVTNLRKYLNLDHHKLSY